MQSLIAAALGVARLLGYRGSALDPVQSPAEQAQQQQADRQRTEPSEPRALLRRLRDAVLFLRERRDRVVEATHGGGKTGPRDTSTRRTIVPRGEQRLHALAVGRAEALFDGRGPSARHSELLQVAQARCQLLVLAQALRDGGVRPSLAPAGQPSPRQRVDAGAERTRALHDRLSLPRLVRFAASVIRHHQHPRDHGQRRHEDGHDAQRPPAQERARAQVTTSFHTLRDRWSARGLKPWRRFLRGSSPRGHQPRAHTGPADHRREHGRPSGVDGHADSCDGGADGAFLKTISDRAMRRLHLPSAWRYTLD